MKSRLFMFGILAIALVFTMTVVSCGGDGGYPNILDVYNLKTTPPSSPVLTKYRLTPSLYDTLTGDSGYKGWNELTAHDGPVGLVLIYTDQNISGFNAARGELNEVFTDPQRQNYEDNEHQVCSVGGILVGLGNGAFRVYHYELLLYKRTEPQSDRFFYPDFYFCPAGTMMITFYYIDSHL